MKRCIEIILISAILLLMIPTDILADTTGFYACFSDFGNPEADSESALWIGAHEYKNDGTALNGNYLQINCMPEGDYSSPKTGLVFPTVNIEGVADTYAVIQLDFRMENLYKSKNLYINFPGATERFCISPYGEIIFFGHKYKIRDYIEKWSEADWTRFSAIFRLTDNFGNPKVQLSGMYINDIFIDVEDIECETEITELSLITMYLSTRKTDDPEELSYYVDADNVGIYIQRGEIPQIADKTELISTIEKYSDYISNLTGADESIVSDVEKVLKSAADTVNNVMSSENQISEKITEIEDLYAELFLGDTYEERKEYMYQKYSEIKAIVDSFDNGEEIVYSKYEIEAMRNICIDVLSSYNDELAPLFIIEAQIDKMESYISIDSYFVQEISVKKDGALLSAFVPGAILEEITLKKRNSDAFCGDLYIGFFDENDVLKSIFSKSVNIESETVGDVELDLSDKNFVLDDDVREDKICIYLWDKQLNPAMDKVSWQSVDNWNVYYNGSKILPDSMPIYKHDGNIYVGVKYFLNLMGITLEKYGGSYYANRSDGAYIKFNTGDSFVSSDKGDIELSEPISLIEETMVILPVEILGSIFGCVLDNVDDINEEIYITYDFTEQYAQLDKNLYPTEYNCGEWWANYKISPVSEVENIEVWYKSAWENDDSSFNSEDYNFFMDTRYWHKAPNPVKTEDGAFIGSLSYLKASRYDIKYVITENGQKNTYVDAHAFTSSKTDDNKSLVIYNAETLKLVPTYENLSYYIDYKNYPTAKSCEITYRKLGEEEWHKAYEPFCDTVEMQFRGSIVKLEDNTAYEVKSVIKDENLDVLNEQIQTVTTWNNEPDCKVVSLSEYIDSFSREGNTITEAIQLCGIKGTAENWIKIDCSGYTVDAGCNYVSAVNIDDCEYMILDGLTVKGGYRSGIAVNGSCYNVRISNCDISEFGRTGIQREDGKYYRDGTFICYDAGVLLLDARNITVESCFIHDSNSKTNAWSGATWSRTHPAGSTGIFYRVKDGCVIRYNDIIGNSEHRWNDGIESWGNDDYTGGPARDTDIYGNMITYGQDDGMELDGSQMNVRVYGNRIEQFLSGVSLSSNLIGPSYLFENVITNMGTEAGAYGKAFKAGRAASNLKLENSARSYLFNNTCFLNGVVTQDSEYNFVTRNNIFVNISGGTCYSNTTEGIFDDNNYDLCYGNNVNYNNGGNSIIYVNANGTEYEKVNPDVLYERLAFSDRENGIFNLTDESLFKNSGIYIDNFCEINKPALGAFQNDSTVIPARPIDMYADK